MTQELSHKCITKSRNHDDYVDDVRVRRDRNSSISSSSVDFSVFADFHPNFLPLMTKFMEFLISQPEYNRIVHGSSNFPTNYSQISNDNSSEFESNRFQNVLPDSIESRTSPKTDSSAEISIGSKIKSNKRSFFEITNEQRLSNWKEEAGISQSTETSNPTASFSQHQEKKKVTFSTDAENLISNPKIKAVSLGEISVSPDKRDQNGLNDFISEISTSISGINAALVDITRLIDRLEQMNAIIRNKSTEKPDHSKEINNDKKTPPIKTSYKDKLTGDSQKSEHIIHETKFIQPKQKKIYENPVENEKPPDFGPPITGTEPPEIDAATNLSNRLGNSTDEGKQFKNSGK